MPFTMCVVTELLRTDVATRSIDHCATQDVVIQGHKIPKGMQSIESNQFTTGRI